MGRCSHSPYIWDFCSQKYKFFLLRIDMDFNNKIAVVTGENICIDGGMTRQMIYHGENGCVLEKGR